MNDILITQILADSDMEELIRLFNKEAAYGKKAETPLQEVEGLV